jgi:Cd2+/Zn2+-exporting ATPase
MSHSTTYHVPSLDCPDELALVQRSFRKTRGIGELAPDYLARNLRVEYDPEQTDSAQILQAIQAAGFRAQLALPISKRQHVASAEEPPQRLARLTTYVGGALLAAALAAKYIFAAPASVIVVSTIFSAIVSGIPIAVTAVRAIRLRALDMNVLMMIAAAGAIAVGDSFEAATAMFLFAVSLWLERLSLGRAQRAIRSLLAVAPNVAHRILLRGTSQESIVDVHPDELSVGELVLVRPGERLPTDGEVTSGESAVNQAPITGESLPVQKTASDHVFAGTLNGEGALVVKVTSPAGATTLARISQLVDEARASRSQAERFIDAFARRYTPVVIAIALAVMIGPPLASQIGTAWASGISATTWIERGLVLLVIACPCALVISTPITVVSALYQATRHGILVKGGQFLDAAAKICTIALDKTGTVTTGKMELEAVEAINGHTADEVLSVAAALERHSEHPVALAVIEAAGERAGAIASSVTALRGLGVQGEIDGQTYFLGNARLFSDARFRFHQEDQQSLKTAASKAGTVAWLATTDRLLGRLRLADRPRRDVGRAIAELRKLGVRRVVMLTGDNAEAANAVAREIGIGDVRADLLPQDKIAEVHSLRGNGPVAMVGDGVNDAPALAAADIGVALGSQSSDTALETADVVVMTPDLMKVAELVRLGRRCRLLLKQNIAFALATKLAVMLLAVGGFATMWMAVAADVGSSLVVIANALRMITVRK